MEIDNEDLQFWLAEVKPIKPQTSDLSVAEPLHRDISISQHRQYAVKQEFSTYSKALDDFSNGGIDKATLRRFKREEFRVEEVLDLHGLNEDAAFVKVDDFIARCYNEGKRCVIIVTGKGGMHEDTDIFAPRGILRKQVPQWLNMPRLRAMILVYKTTSERLGGSGALYILLKRNKDI